MESNQEVILDIEEDDEEDDVSTSEEEEESLNSDFLSYEPLAVSKFRDQYKFEPIILDRYQKSSQATSPIKSPKDSHKKRQFMDILAGDSKLHKIISSYTLRALKPIIWQDFEARPAKVRLLEEILTFHHVDDSRFVIEQYPITYCYFTRKHIKQVNTILCEYFWPGIDVSEFVEFPDFTVLAMYKKKVIGCGFITPEAYITYIVVHPEWRCAGIASFMLYHLVQTVKERDITLHVSVTNTAMLLYQKFGFKPEEYIVDFYHKYYPPNSLECFNAFFMRLRR